MGSQSFKSYVSPSFWQKIKTLSSPFPYVVLGGGGLFYYYLSLFTFSSQDPSYYTALVPAPLKVGNGGGTLGAELSAHLFTWLGVGAYVLPLWWCLLVGYYRFQVRSPLMRNLLILGQGCLGVFLVVVFGYLSSLFQDRGGWLGVVVGESLERHLGFWGSWALVITLSFALVAGKMSPDRAPLSYIRGWLGRGGRVMRASLSEGFTRFRGLVAPYIYKEESFLFRVFGLGRAGTEEKAVEVVGESSKEHAPSLDQGEEVGYLDQKYREFFRRQKAKVRSTLGVGKDEGGGRAAQRVLSQTLEDFQIFGKMLGYQTGPRVRTFEFEPAAGVKQTKLTSLGDDIARALKVESVIIQPIPGKSSMGVQVPRRDGSIVYLGDILSGRKEFKEVLPLGMGMNPAGRPVIMDLAKMPHLLMAGATGSGKSVGIHALINSLICSCSPEEVRLILVDPKMLELSAYSSLPHLAAPVITDVHQACAMLEWAVQEMECRYRLMQDMEVRNIAEFHRRQKKLSQRQKQKEQQLYPDSETLPYLVIIIDELADLMLMAPKDVEASIQRLSQKARASGIHLVLATQRPSVDVITGVIKANFPARMAYQVVSKHDSRTILDQVGAEKLLGKGDMLFQSPLKLKPERLQGAYVSEEEIRALLAKLSQDYPPSYISSLEQKLTLRQKGEELSSTQSDPKWSEALEVAQAKGSISASYLQRRLQVGYNRAARMIEAMESEGLIASASGVKPRKWLGGARESPS